jgi:CDGSH-type Zn-finger protein
MTDQNNATPLQPKIEVRPNGPYKVTGSVPLVHKTQVVSEHGEPLTWQKDDTYPACQEYILCRCGQSQKMPYCDLTHREKPYDGTETAQTNTTAERQEIFRYGTNVVVKYDDSLCCESGYCATRNSSIQEMVPDTDDTAVRSNLMAMIERCPAGAYVYSIEEGGPDIEPDLPMQIAATTEITSNGPITGPLWVTGSIQILRADGQPMETRNRVTLCNCGKSKLKPLCDGTHRPKD